MVVKILPRNFYDIPPINDEEPIDDDEPTWDANIIVDTLPEYVMDNDDIAISLNRDDVNGIVIEKNNLSYKNSNDKSDDDFINDNEEKKGKKFKKTICRNTRVVILLQSTWFVDDIPSPAINPTQIGGGRTSMDEATPVPNSGVISHLPSRGRCPNVIVPNPLRRPAKERLVVPSVATRMVMEGRLKFSDGQLARTSVFKRSGPVNSETIDTETPRKSFFDRLTTSTGVVAEMTLRPRSKSFKRNARRSLKRRQEREDKGQKHYRGPKL
uniref:Uncharacterized protein n=1 Tax=Ananas comosus var. bracteatus TaxID=296719 RepID=A0A6V7NTK7_ANACO|nr:unnamed protein product [Ananas comosus var. bracteatus]